MNDDEQELIERADRLQFDMSVVEDGTYDLVSRVLSDCCWSAASRGPGRSIDSCN